MTGEGATVTHAERLELARSGALPVSVQLDLARDDMHHVRLELASNASVGEEAQGVLAQDASWEVRSRLAKNAVLARSTQQVLGSDTDTFVLECLTSNGSVVLDATFPLPCLEWSQHVGARIIGETLRGVDEEAVSALRDGWTGTLLELAQAAQELGPGTS